MMKRLCLLLTVVVMAGCSQQPAQQASESASPAAAPAAAPANAPVTPPATDEAKIASAVSAAPASIGKDASVIDMDASGQMKTLRQGTNMWTCVPDTPSPGPDPMCVDKNGAEFLQAMMQHKNPPAGKSGFGYMLKGGSDASNEDPFAAGPADGKSWISTGPHVMIFNIGKQYDGYPTTAADTAQPYVMWANTPYAHLMIPVQ
jgi:hypothetical protein